jgi:hypothetical protein
MVLAAGRKPHAPVSWNFAGATANSTRDRYLPLAMLLRAAFYGFIRPCLPSSAEHPPSGPGWIHEIKHDGYRLMVRRDQAAPAHPQRRRLVGEISTNFCGRGCAQDALLPHRRRN